VLMGLQLIHAFSFGAIHAVSIEFVRRWFPDRLSGRGMALYSGLVFGTGGALGSLSSGYLWDALGGGRTFEWMGVLTLITACVAWFGLRSARLEAQQV